MPTLHLTVDVLIENKRREYYRKEIKMSGTPFEGLSISEEGCVFKIASLIYNIGDDKWYGRINEQINDETDPTESWEFLQEFGWTKD